MVWCSLEASHHQLCPPRPNGSTPSPGLWSSTRRSIYFPPWASATNSSTSNQTELKTKVYCMCSSFQYTGLCNWSLQLKRFLILVYTPLHNQTKLLPKCKCSLPKHGVPSPVPTNCNNTILYSKTLTKKINSFLGVFGLIAKYNEFKTCKLYKKTLKKQYTLDNALEYNLLCMYVCLYESRQTI